MYITNLGISSDEIARRIKQELKNPPNRIEGSFASDNAQAVAKEMFNYYMAMDYLHKMHYVDTATGHYLDKKASEIGVFRQMPFWAIGYVTFYGREGTEIPFDFEVKSESQVFKTLESGAIPASGELTLKVESLYPGTRGNVPAMSITEFPRLSGLRKILNKEPTTSGAEAETDESLRERTLLRMRYPGTSGNQYHYMHWAREVEGVGRVKVFPLWQGSGTVKVSILDRNQRVASSDLIKRVKNHIDPSDRAGEALAPIGAYLTVTTATERKINVTAKITLINEEYTREAITETFKKDLQAYFDEIAYTTKRNITTAKIIDVLWGVAGVMDITEYSIGGNILLGEEEIASVGTVTIT